MLLRSAVLMVKNTHRPPADRALHVAGAPLYAAGIAMVVAGYLAGVGTDVVIGAAMWSVAIAMFVAGHAIEGNVMSMTPLLLARLVRRSLAGHLGRQRIHLLRR
ncbi:MAG: hypothetical protein ABI347_11345 [Nitrososphaera sp.]|jgi:hypothetical protein